MSGSAAPLPRAAGEPPVYRPFALLAFAVALVAGVPLGIWMLARLYLGGGPIPPAWLPLHAHLQVFGFFGVLILGVAQHLVPRFAGRPVTRGPASVWLFGAVSAAVLARVAGTIAGRPGWVLAATLVEAGAFLGFAAWVWRSLAAPPLSVTRTHLGLGAGWLVAALAAEAVLRWRALGPEGAEPDPAGMRAVYLAGLLGGVVGWIVGVALRAGPMFVPGWRVPGALARGAPWALALGVLTAVAGELGPWDASTATALAKLGESVGLATVAAVALAGGLLRRAPRALPILGRGGPETRTFRLAVLSAALAAAGSATAAALAWRSIPLSLLADALRHLTTVGFLTAMVVGMVFRLVPVFEGVPLPWPGLRAVAFWALLAGVLLRTGEVLADYGAGAILPWLPLSGGLVWGALACVALNLVGALRQRARGDTPVPRGATTPPVTRG